MNAIPHRNDPCPCGSGKKFKRCCLEKMATRSHAAEDASQHVQSALQHHRAGRMQQAEALYLQALQLAPNHPDALYLLAQLNHQAGRDEAAFELIKRAIRVRPADPFLHDNLGSLYRAQNRLREAEASFLRALELKPDFAGAHYNLGVTVQDLGRPLEAERSYRRALAIESDYVYAHFNLGIVLREQGRLSEAEASYLRALKIDPDFADAHYNLGLVLHDQGRMNEAGASYARALEIDPEFAKAHNNLGIVLQDRGRTGEAEASFRRALQIDPGYAEAHSNLGGALRDLGQLVGAEASFRRALELKPDIAEAHQSLSSALAYLSDYREVVAESDLALRLKPGDARIWEQRLYAYSYHPELSAAEIYAEFVRWGDRFPDPVIDFSRHDRTPGRRLRVGYVSPDFQRHTSRFFFWPLFANHDHAVVELYAYSNVKAEDEYTAQFKGLFDHWRNIRDVADGEAARMVREDGIDILVDCCNHMRDDRLGVFALKPAPVQATWLGAAWTTGLKAVDYALLDPYMAPEGTLARETIVRLPHFFVAYRPPEQTAEIAPPPCVKNGYVTFGYSGRTERLNHRCLRVWGEILRQIPDARLILDYQSFADPPTQAYYRQYLAQLGVDTERVLMRRSENIFAGLNDFDILLDCFPHSGGTMLFDALWMGVPALTLAGRPPLGRIGTSLMMNLDMPEWVARTEDDYVAKACALAGNAQVLAPLRAGMRERMRNSPVMDGAGFARAVEAAYREMFGNWARG
jgi:predicted O-linked N-acetylglucosamine transferase (SPINDLY family)